MRSWKLAIAASDELRNSLLVLRHPPPRASMRTTTATRNVPVRTVNGLACKAQTSSRRKYKDTAKSVAVKIGFFLNPKNLSLSIPELAPTLKDENPSTKGQIKLARNVQDRVQHLRPERLRLVGFEVTPEASLSQLSNLQTSNFQTSLHRVTGCWPLVTLLAPPFLFNDLQTAQFASPLF